MEMLGLDEVRLEFSNAPSRLLTPRVPRLVATVPAFVPIQIEAHGIKSGAVIARSCAQLGTLKPGQDVKVELKDCL